MYIASEILNKNQPLIIDPLFKRYLWNKQYPNIRINCFCSKNKNKYLPPSNRKIYKKLVQVVTRDNLNKQNKNILSGKK